VKGKIRRTLVHRAYGHHVAGTSDTKVKDRSFLKPQSRKWSNGRKEDIFRIRLNNVGCEDGR
jgi:hypothetical protein